MLGEYPYLADANSNKFIHNNIVFASIMWDIDQMCLLTYSYFRQLACQISCLDAQVLFFRDCTKAAVLSSLTVA